MVRLVIAEPLLSELPPLHEQLARHEQVRIVGYAHDAMEAAQMALSLRPDALLVAQDVAGLSGPELCRLVSQVAPQVPCVLISEATDPATLQMALSFGARAVLGPREEVDRAVETLHHLVELARPSAASELARITDPGGLPTTVAGVGAPGGAGVTTVLSNLAVLLAQTHPQETVLVDWHLQVGDLVAGLGLHPAHGMSDFAVYGAQLDAEALNECLVPHASGLLVLAGSVAPAQAWLEPLPRVFAAQLLGLLRRRFMYILCDLPSVWGPAELYVCTHAQELLVVGALHSVRHLRTAATLVDLLRAQQVPAEHLRLVINRQERGAPHRPEDLARLTGLPVAAVIPEDPAVQRALGSGEPVALSSRKAPASVAFGGLTAQVEAWRSASPASQAGPGPQPAPAEPQEVSA